jgi:glycosyl transferase family 2
MLAEEFRVAGFHSARTLLAVARPQLPDGVRIPEPREDVRHRLGEHFEALRRNRRARRSGGSRARKRRAVLTIVHNEAVFLPIWLGYYSRFFAPEDIYVLDHETRDGSTAGDAFVRIPVAHETVDHTWMVRTIEQHQHELLDRYDVVLVTDVDEIVAPNPAWGTLGEYINGFEEEYVNCLGYEILHLVDRERPFDLSRKVLDQRRYWFANEIYDKPALATEPMRWKPGFHRTEDGRMRPDPDLRLIHLHRMDYEICRERHRHRQARSWNERDVTLDWATHNRITEEAAFAHWFYEDTNVAWNEMIVERIPATWRGVF